jgi:hypothetical protein
VYKVTNKEGFSLEASKAQSTVSKVGQASLLNVYLLGEREYVTQKVVLGSCCAWRSNLAADHFASLQRVGWWFQGCRCLVWDCIFRLS